MPRDSSGNVCSFQYLVQVRHWYLSMLLRSSEPPATYLPSNHFVSIVFSFAYLEAWSGRSLLVPVVVYTLDEVQVEALWDRMTRHGKNPGNAIQR